MKKMPKCKHEQQPMGYLKVRCLEGQKRVQFSPIAKCALYKRCLPKFKGPWDISQLEHEATIFKLCHLIDGTHCVDYQAKEN